MSFLKKLKGLLYGPIKVTSVKNVQAFEQLGYPAETFFVPENKDIFGNNPAGFRQYEANIPALYVRSFKNAFCFTNREEVFTSQKQLIAEYSTVKENPLLKASNAIFRKTKTRRVSGTVAHLSLSGLENNYYHFLTECLGRFFLLEKAGIKPDCYIIADHLKFQSELLALLGIAREKIISTSSNQLIQAETLIVPDFINNWTEVIFRDFTSYSKQWAPYWLKDFYHEKIAMLKRTSQQGRKIFISREKAPGRKIINYEEVKPLIIEMGFEIHCLEDLTNHEQIKLFAEASAIVGIHGAGFANLYFTTGPVKFIEIFSEFYHDPSFRVLTAGAGMEYNYLLGKSPVVDHISAQNEDIYLDANELKLALIKASV